MSGFSEGYDEWLNGFLETEDSLSDVVLSLSLCGSDVNETISCLQNYCGEQDFDEKHVCEKLRLFLKDGYYSGRFSKEETVAYMYRFASSHGDPGGFEMDIWGVMFYMDYYHSLAKDGLISWDRFDSAFLSYLNDGSPLDIEKLWDRQQKVPRSLLKRIFRKN